MTGYIDAPGWPDPRPDYDERHLAPVLGWLVAIPCGMALWAAVWWVTVTALAR